MKATPEDVAKLCRRDRRGGPGCRASMKATPEDVAKSAVKLYPVLRIVPQ